MTVVRRILALAALVLGVLAAAVVVAAPAGALGFDCTDAPAPEVPGRGLTGFFAGAPDPLPPAGDPFAADATTTIYEQYGYAGLRWNNYDLGCGPDATRAPDAVAGTAMANWLFNLPKVAVAFTNAVVGVAFSPSFFSVFDPVVEQVSGALYTNVFAAWVPVTLAAVGFLLIWRARRANLASSAAAIGWAALVLVVATALFRWPAEAGSAADSSMSAALSTVSRSVGGGPDDASPSLRVGRHDAAPVSGARMAGTAAATHEALLYNAWAAGTFGDARSDTALKYGPAIFDATALTWREADTLRTDPAAGRKIVEAKQRAFSSTAEKIKSEDPDAYQYLTGKRSDARVGYALLAAFGALCALPFLFGAALMVLASFLILRLAVMLFPAVATLGVFPAMRHQVVGIASMVAGALVNALLFGVAAVVSLRGVELLLAPAAPLPQWLAMTLLFLFGAVLWMALRPVRRLALMFGADVKPAGRLALPRYLRRRQAPEPAGSADPSESLAGGPQPARRLDRAAVPARAELFSLPESRPRAVPAAPAPLSHPGPARPRSPQTPVGRAGTRPADGSPPATPTPAPDPARAATTPVEAYAAVTRTPEPTPARWNAARPGVTRLAPQPARRTGRVRSPYTLPQVDDPGRDFVPHSTTPLAERLSGPPESAYREELDVLGDLNGIYRPGPRPADGS